MFVQFEAFSRYQVRLTAVVLCICMEALVVGAGAGASV